MTKRRKADDAKENYAANKAADKQEETKAGKGEEGPAGAILETGAPPAKLTEFDFKTLPENFFVVCYGARRTGKSWLMNHALAELKDRFDYAYCFSATAALNDGFPAVRPEAVFNDFDEGILTQLMQRQKAWVEHNKNVKHKADEIKCSTLLIFDDFVHNVQVRYSQQFVQLPVLGRHYKLSCILLSQGYGAVASGGLNPATRMNADAVITFMPRSTLDCQKIAEWYLTMPKKEGGEFVKAQTAEKHRALVVDLQDPSDIDEASFCHTVKAPSSKVKPYELGKEQWRQFRISNRAKKEYLRHMRNDNEAMSLQEAQRVNMGGAPFVGLSKAITDMGMSMHGL